MSRVSCFFLTHSVQLIKASSTVIYIAKHCQSSCASWKTTKDRNVWCQRHNIYLWL